MLEVNKLVRDRVPDLIRGQGRRCTVRVLDATEYRAALDRKLAEEVDEYLRSGDPAELTDIVEVVYAIALGWGINREQFERLREAKRGERGGFEARLLLVDVDD